MPRKAQELTALQVGRIKKPGLHFVGGVAGLAMQVAPGGARTWILRIAIAGRRRDMGLGGFPDVPLARAREKARDARDKVDNGIDPILQRQETKSALRASAAAAKTLAECFTAYIDAKSAGWSNPKHIQQWTNTFEEYVAPVAGKLLVRDVSLAHVSKILEPIWTTKTETASRVRGRIEAVLDWATVRGYRSGENPARWRGHLDKLFPAPTKVAKVKHHAALDVEAMPSFMAALRSQSGLGARALEFAVLTAARSGEVRGATWDEIDLETGTWIIPGERMKAGREHRVPLTHTAVRLLKSLPRSQDTALVFPSARSKPLSDMTLTGVTRRMGVAAVPHGFRSTFKDWASERTNYPGEMSEMALAHAVGDKVEAAYRRGDLFEKRRRMMVDWDKFCSSTRLPADVVSLSKRRSQTSKTAGAGK